MDYLHVQPHFKRQENPFDFAENCEGCWNVPFHVQSSKGNQTNSSQDLNLDHIQGL